MLQQPSRKFFVTIAVLAVAALLLGSCAPAATPTTAAPTSAPATAVPAQPTSTTAAAQPAATTAAAQPTATTSAAQPTSTAAASTAPVTINFWSHDFKPRETLDDKFIAAFEAAHPNIKVVYTIGPGNDTDYLTKLTTAYAGNAAPDCFNLRASSAGALLAANEVVPLDPKAFGFATVDELVKSYVPGTLNGFYYKGQLFAIPTEVNIHAVYVNTALFKAAGLDPVKDAPKTWDDLLTINPKLLKTQNGVLSQRGFDFIYGLPDDASGPINTLAGMAYQLGGTIMNADQTAATVNTDPWIRTFQYVQDWVYKYKFGGPQYTSYYLAFINGSEGMGISGSFLAADLVSQKSPAASTYAVIQMPRWKDATNNTGALLYGYGLFTNATSSPDKQAACQMLIKELSSHPEDYLRDAALLQPTIALSQTNTFKNTPYLNVFLQDMVGTPWMPVHPKYSQIIDSLVRALQRVTTEQQPVKQALDTANTEITAILNGQ
jgi:multiple sugar transport system substrate-binding protein